VSEKPRARQSRVRNVVASYTSSSAARTWTQVPSGSGDNAKLGSQILECDALVGQIRHDGRHVSLRA